MKVEVICNGLRCPTRIDRAQPQLVRCHKLRLGNGQVPLDEDYNPIGCPWCGNSVTFERVSSDQAQFALGRVEVLNDAREVLGGEEHWLEEAAALVAMHVAGLYGSSADEFRQRNDEIIGTLPFAQTTDNIVSQYFTRGTIIWVITKPALGITQVLARPSMEKRATGS